MERRQLAAQHRGGASNRLSGGGARITDRGGRLSVLGEQTHQHLRGEAGDLHLMPGQEGVEVDRQPRVKGDRPRALGSR